MAAPDKVYRYFTNLKARTYDSSNDTYDTFFVRVAKPLASYVTSGLSYAQQLEELKSKFKIDGILWIKNPDTPCEPYTSADDPNTVVVEDPTSPSGTATIVDPDLDDPDRSGFIAYVYPSGNNAAFHDIETTPKNQANPAAYQYKDYADRSWSRASRFRYKAYQDSEEAIILNDAGLNRRGECSVATRPLDPRIPNWPDNIPQIDLNGSDTATFGFKGIFAAAPYNRVYTWGLKYVIYTPVENAATIDSEDEEHNENIALFNQRVLAYGPERIVLGEPAIPKGGMRDASSTPYYFTVSQTDVGYLSADKIVYYRPFVINEEGTYQLDYDPYFKADISRYMFKAKFLAVADPLNNFNTFKTWINNPANQNVDESSIYENNIENDEFSGALYLNSKIVFSDIDVNTSMPVYDVKSARDYTTFKNGDATDHVTGYHYGGRRYSDYIGYYYPFAVLVNESNFATMKRYGVYTPIIPGLQDIQLTVYAEYANSSYSAINYSIQITVLGINQPQIAQLKAEVRFLDEDHPTDPQHINTDYYVISTGSPDYSAITISGLTKNNGWSATSPQGGFSIHNIHSQFESLVLYYEFYNSLSETNMSGYVNIVDNYQTI